MQTVNENRSAIATLLRQAAQDREDIAVGPSTKLGLGSDPGRIGVSLERSQARRRVFLADAAYFHSLAKVVETREWPEEARDGQKLDPLQTIMEMVSPICPVTSERIRFLVEGE